MTRVTAATEARKGRKDRAFGSRVCLHLQFGLVALRTVREEVSVLLFLLFEIESHSVVQAGLEVSL